MMNRAYAICLAPLCLFLINSSILMAKIQAFNRDQIYVIQPEKAIFMSDSTSEAEPSTSSLEVQASDLSADNGNVIRIKYESKEVKSVRRQIYVKNNSDKDVDISVRLTEGKFTPASSIETTTGGSALELFRNYDTEGCLLETFNLKMKRISRRHPKEKLVSLLITTSDQAWQSDPQKDTQRYLKSRFQKIIKKFLARLSTIDQELEMTQAAFQQIENINAVVLSIPSENRFKTILSEAFSDMLIEADGLLDKCYVVPSSAGISNAGLSSSHQISPTRFGFAGEWVTDIPKLADDLRAWGHKKARIAQAWRFETGSPAVRTAVLDTGIDLTNSYLRPAIWINTGETFDNTDSDGNGYVDDLYGFSADPTSPDVQDIDGHGTQVASLIGGQRGFAGPPGVVFNSKFVVVKMQNPSKSMTVGNALTSLAYAISVGVDVCNCSWGSYDSAPLLEVAMKQMEVSRGGRGILAVLAAGNEGVNTESSPFYPASYKLSNGISVASLNLQGKLASHSNYGATTVDIAAPGDGIFTATVDGGFTYKSGTSLAAPYVAGVAAMIYSFLQREQNYPHYTEVKDIILSTADRNDSFSGFIKTGALNAEAAMMKTRLGGAWVQFACNNVRFKLKKGEDYAINLDVIGFNQGVYKAKIKLIATEFGTSTIAETIAIPIHVVGDTDTSASFSAATGKIYTESQPGTPLQPDSDYLCATTNQTSDTTYTLIIIAALLFGAVILLACFASVIIFKRNQRTRASGSRESIASRGDTPQSRNPRNSTRNSVQENQADDHESPHNLPERRDESFHEDVTISN